MKGLLITYSLIISLMCAIAGCGGGGSSKSSPSSTQSSSQGQTSSAPGSAASITSSSALSSVAASSSAPSIQLTIQGKVVADALVGGEIVFTIGNHTVKTGINDSLEYSVLLDVSDVDANKPFVAVATGVGADSWVQLATLFPSVNTLVEKAGSDKVLSIDDFFGVNITPLTTAEYAEVINSHLSYSTEEERKSAIISLHPTKALEQAAMIVRFLTNINVNLPAQTESTLTYLLDAQLSETYLEALRVSSEEELNKYVNEIAEDSAHVNVSQSKLSGTYILEAYYSNYLLTFNEDGTGQLATGHITYDILIDGGLTKVNQAFTWIRKSDVIEMVFVNPVVYQGAHLRDADGIYRSCSSDWMNEICQVTIKSVRLHLMSESNSRYIAKLTMSGDVTPNKDDSYSYQLNVEPQLARVISTTQFIPQDLSGLFDAEWVSNQNSFVFSKNGDVLQKNLLTQVEMQKSWTLQGNHIAIEGFDLWITHKEQAGFSAFMIDDGNVSRQKLVKRLPVTMNESDWVGRWNSYPRSVYETNYDIYADKTWSYGLGPVKGEWSMPNEHRQIAMAKDSRITRDVVAVVDGKYFINDCWGDEATPFVARNCNISVEEKSADFESAILWSNWSTGGFNEAVTNEPLFYWADGFYQNQLSDGFVQKSYTRVTATSLFSPSDNKILEVISAKQNEVELCEYSVGKPCAENEKRKYIIGTRVNLSVGPGGFMGLYLTGDSFYDWRAVDRQVIIPKGVQQKFILFAESGYSVDTAAGCDGVLNGNEYTIPPLTNTCDIVVKFKKL